MAKKDSKKKSDNVDKPDLAVHETIELHEVMTVKQASLMKAGLMESLVEDSKLREIVRKEKKLSKKAINEIQELLP
ncbi:spore coat protein [Salinicoccus sp. ID82-1]|uniref:Spore coat protein n=1 Tax=Salinicoccus cyprini TaxID=2493691 RepID=A0A558AX55_9STAP|nr:MULTISPECIES: spore coat protein [Salinicoccus]MCG1009985.1 spore coat protein [Salinicoccus sp. ID82-1]TVT28843.1 spore coat protein [Salinicoccus cyprini]